MAESRRSTVRSIGLYLFALYVVPVLFLVAVVTASRATGLSIAVFVRDPAAVAGIHPFIGVASSVGAFLWAATAAICAFGWAALRRRGGEAGLSTFLLCAALLSTLLLLDDFFMLHETVHHQLGVSEKALVAAYGGLVVASVVAFRRGILRTDVLVLGVAIGFFALSVFIDAFQHRIEAVVGESWRILVEDGAKLLGIVGWLGYFARVALLAVDPPRPRS